MARDYGQGKPRGDPGTNEVATGDVDQGERGVGVCGGKGCGWSGCDSGIDWDKHINPAI